MISSARPLDVNLPGQFNRFTMYSFISEIIYEDNTPKSGEIIFNFSTLSFIRPSGVTILDNILQWLFKQGVKIQFRFPCKKASYAENDDPIKYLDDCGFFERYLSKKIYEYSEKRSTTILVKRVTIEEYHYWLNEILMPWIASRLNAQDTRGFGGLKACIAEIFNNIKDHSGENIGCVFAQHYPREDKIQIAISDFGMGIPNQIKKKFDFNHDGEALEIAIMEGTTTLSLPTNRGAGLETLTGYVVENNNGQLYIHSNRGRLSCSQDQGKKKVSSQSVSGFYPGTLLLIKLNTNGIYEEPLEEDFSW